MDQLTDVKIPATEIIPRDLPDPQRENIPLPTDPNTFLLAGLFLLATLAAAYFSAEVMLPIVLAFVLSLLLSPGVRLLSRLHFPRWLSALLLVLVVLTTLFAFVAAVSGPART